MIIIVIIIIVIIVIIVIVVLVVVMVIVIVIVIAIVIVIVIVVLVVRIAIARYFLAGGDCTPIVHSYDACKPQNLPALDTGDNTGKFERGCASPFL